MAARRDKIGIGVMRPCGTAAATDRAEEAVLRLARLIGRQMAREQFERTRAQEHSAGRKRDRT
jgi:hypothetical protein